MLFVTQSTEYALRSVIIPRRCMVAQSPGVPPKFQCWEPHSISSFVTIKTARGLCCVHHSIKALCSLQSSSCSSVLQGRCEADCRALKATLMRMRNMLSGCGAGKVLCEDVYSECGVLEDGVAIRTKCDAMGCMLKPQSASWHRVHSNASCRGCTVIRCRRFQQ